MKFYLSVILLIILITSSSGDFNTESVTISVDIYAIGPEYSYPDQFIDGRLSLEDPGINFLWYNVSGMSTFTINNSTYLISGSLFMVIDGIPQKIRYPSPLPIYLESGTHIISLIYLIYSFTENKILYSIDTVHINADKYYSSYNVENNIELNSNESEMSFKINGMTSGNLDTSEIILTGTSVDMGYLNENESMSGITLIFDAKGLHSIDNLNLISGNNTVSLIYFRPLGYSLDTTEYFSNSTFNFETGFEVRYFTIKDYITITLEEAPIFFPIWIILWRRKKK